MLKGRVGTGRDGEMNEGVSEGNRGRGWMGRDSVNEGSSVNGGTKE